MYQAAIAFLRLRVVSPDLSVALMEHLGQQLGGLMEAATQLVQLLLHGEDPLLQLPVRVVPIGAEVAHDHLHLLTYGARPELSVCKIFLQILASEERYFGCCKHLNSFKTKARVPGNLAEWKIYLPPLSSKKNEFREVLQILFLYRRSMCLNGL